MSVVRPPVITEDDLGPAGWRRLHELTELRGRKRARNQIIPLLQWALAQSLAGVDVEPNGRQFKLLREERVLEVA